MKALFPKVADEQLGGLFVRWDKTAAQNAVVITVRMQYVRGDLEPEPVVAAAGQMIRPEVIGAR